MKFEQLPQQNNFENKKPLISEDELTQKLKSLDKDEIDVDAVANRTKQLNEKIEQDKLLGHLNKFYAENLQNIGKSVTAEFKMRPIYKKYIAIEKENNKIYKENRRRENIKEKNPNTAEDTSLVDYLDTDRSDIFDQAQNFKKIPEIVEKNKYNETNLEDLKSYQENYNYRRYKNAFVSDLRSETESEYTILNRLYAIQLNQIREKLKNNQDLKENLDVYLQPATAIYRNSDHYEVFSEKNAQLEKTEYSLGVTNRINSLIKAFEEDKIILSEEQKEILQKKIVEIFEKNSKDISSSDDGDKSMSSLIALSGFKEDQKKILNSILFKLMLKNEKRHWFGVPFGNADFPYTKEQIEIIFNILKQTNIKPDGIRVIHPDKKYYNVDDKESKYDVISINNLAKFPFTNEQKQEIGILISKSIEKEFDDEVAKNDFRYFLNFIEEKSYLKENGFLTQEQFSELANLSDRLFFSATENYLNWSFEHTKRESGISTKYYHVHMDANFDISEISNLIKILEDNSNDTEKANKILETIPWKKSIDTMGKIQNRSRCAAYDPWINEIKPLVKRLIENKELSLGNQKDGEILLEYIKKVGPKNLYSYFKLFKSLQTAKSVNELSIDKKDDLKKSFNIDADEICKNDPSNINLIVNEMEKYRASFNTDLINESKDLPDRILQSQYNRESFNSIVGRLPDNTIMQFKKTLNKNPELFMLPEGYEKVDVKIGEYGEKNSTDLLKNEEQIKSLLENQDLLNYHNKIFATIDSFKEGNTIWEKDENFNSNINNIFNSEINLINKKSNNSKDNPKILENLSRRKDLLQKQADNFNAFVKSKKDTNNLINLMETYFKLIPDDFSIKQKVLLELSFKDMSKKIPEQFEKLTNPNFVSKNPTVDSVNIFSEFIRSHVKEHYFDKKHGESQKIETENKDLIKYLNKIWGAQDFERSILAITENKIAGLEKGEIKNTKKNISLVPSKGMQRILTGNLGGVCTNRQSDKLAKGEFKNIVSYSIILDKDTSKQKFSGSFLFIETKTATKESI